MARPYDLYVRFLVTKGLTELDEINSNLEELSLKPLKQAEFEPIFDHVYANIPAPVARQIENKAYEGDFLRWMTFLDVRELWEIEKRYRTQVNAHLQLVYDIHYDPMLRLAVQSLIVKKQLPKDICQDLNLKYSYMLRPEHVSLIQKFFWNPARMGRRDWKRYLGICSSFERSTLFICLTEGLASLKGHLGLSGNAEILPVYNKVFTQCAQKVEHYIRLYTKEANYEAREWLNSMLQLGDKIKKFETGNTVDFGKTLQMEFEFISTEFPTPDEVTMKEVRDAREKHEVSEQIVIPIPDQPTLV